MTTISTTYKDLYTHEPYLEYVRVGKKIFEVRLNSKTYRNYTVGIVLRLYNSYTDKGPVFRKISTRRWFPSLKDLFKNVPLKNVLPDQEDVDYSIEQLFYRKFKFNKLLKSGKTKEQEWGVICLGLEEVGGEEEDGEEEDEQDVEGTEEDDEGDEKEEEEEDKEKEKTVFQPLIYKVCYDRETRLFWGRLKDSQKPEPLSITWLHRNGFNKNYRGRCKDNPGHAFNSHLP